MLFPEDEDVSSSKVETVAQVGGRAGRYVFRREEPCGFVSVTGPSSRGLGSLHALRLRPSFLCGGAWPMSDQSSQSRSGPGTNKNSGLNAVVLYGHRATIYLQASHGGRVNQKGPREIWMPEQ